MIRILFILPKTHQGGAETQMFYLLRNLNKKKFVVYLGLLYNDEQLKKEFEAIKGIKIINFRKKNDLDFSIYFKIAKFIKSNNIDIIQTFMGNHHGYIPAFFIKGCTPVGGIRYSPDYEFSSFDKIKRFTIPKILTRLDKFILVSNNYAAKEICEKKGFDSDKIRVIPNGIDYERFSRGTPTKIIKEFKLKDKLVFCMVARLDSVKNHDGLIRLFKKLREEYKNAVLIIVGDGPEMGKLKILASECNESENIIFTGNRKDVPDILAAADVFVFPSKSEGWPNVIGEAMSASLPVVSYPVGDVKLIIKNGFDGIITESNMKSFHEAIMNLIKNKKKMKYIGENAQKTIREKFSVEKMIKEYEEFYLSLLKESEKDNT